MSKHKSPPLPNSQLLAVAVESKTDPRTVRKFLLGGRVHPLIRESIERALAARNASEAR